MRSERTEAGTTAGLHGPAPSFIETSRRAQLIQAAVVTVNEVGYHRASLAEIARRAHIVKSAVAYYFASKEGLLLDVVQTVFGALGERVLAAVDGIADPVARLRAYAEAYVAHVDEERHAIAAAVEIVVSHRTADGTPLYLVEDEEESALLRSILREGIDQGAFAAMPLDVATGLAESMLDRAITLVQRDPEADLSTLRAHIVPFLFRAVGAPDG
ncbi:TetR/AcrR family transcriptional regulator [Brachybacterium phenoliresistens]|uniref:TetR/AcrR family transcriptional regulator n=1 Tax=Brachybacterium phenoliresistens TaxID=396014 RepID=UPI0031D7923F